MSRLMGSGTAPDGQVIVLLAADMVEVGEEKNVLRGGEGSSDD